MKKKNIWIIVFTILTFNVTGQNYAPTTNWPYLYENFQQGTIYLKSGNTLEKSVNIHLVASVLHYVENNMIQELMNTEDVDSIQIKTSYASETFVYIDGRIYRLIEQTDNNNGIFEINIGNFDELLSTTGAYGTKNYTASPTKFVSLNIGGIAERDYLKLSSGKDNGKLFPIDKTYFFKINGKLIKARSKDVENSIDSPQVKKQLQSYLKKNKVKWNNIDSLAGLYRFLLTVQS